jgi:hypothetical protein
MVQVLTVFAAQFVTVVTVLSFVSCSFLFFPLSACTQMRNVNLNFVMHPLGPIS